MRIQQLSELLDYVANCHLDMEKLYKRLDRNADSTRVKMMLTYFQQHQRHIYETLERYIDDAPSRILNTWYKDITFEDFSKRCIETSFPANMDESQVLELHLDLENRLIALLEKTAISSPTDEIRNTLMDLVRVAQTQQKRLVHSTIRMDDI
ncbi:MAG: hypothetical protein V7771_06265 [Shewanella psychromarinicola]|jgi:hypothetical protein|uniref:ATPase n=1 Tax=Shewanella psychromarinicola TaxID=2487742 RepID=A0A3N4E8L2_9GAMM|nr:MULTISPECIES: hypothetical protein [Shewanella]AZG34917.1 hypothetical protein EGC80_08275 [Shewanella psychromarinicola]MCL1080664.1 hypothetical protein [Shewanella psychromarinicola]PKG79912.1 hypothetical protein CXF80_17265 [Shewanella sp. Actino-trap-3]RPA33288.1 hypothetical protein EGC77_08075 [Shewanella psychromarinicola]|tara:strand:+ start:778 stop:1233 length:456 start_codon:yes stop_codon:yes gene_type:complete